MKVRPLGIDGAYEVVPQTHGDARGLFLEWYRFDRLAEVVGRPLDLAQANLSVSGRGVLRGIHYADVPPGQAKYVTCLRGAVLDVVVDVRVGSPTYGRWEGTRLDDVDRRAVYLAEGLGHGFCALTDDATVAYLCSSTYDPAIEHGIDPFDPQLGIRWPAGDLLLSPRDAAAPSLASIVEASGLPSYDVCRSYSSGG
jgi:dTDP-4-dehydrorhamnose 3,5-epimerase